MALTAHERRQLARIEAQLRRNDPELAQALAVPSTGSRKRRLVEIRAPLLVNLTGVAVLVLGALVHHLPLVVADLFGGASGPVIAVAALQIVGSHLDRRRLRGRHSRDRGRAVTR
jgi:Protein of unknown function (DUF3040)